MSSHTSDDLLRQILDDLATECEELDATVSRLDADGWRLPTPAEGWDIAHQIAHLAWTDEVAVLAATDKDAWDAVVTAAVEDPVGFVDTAAAEGAAAAPPAVLARWREARERLRETLLDLPAGTKVPWFGPPMSPTSMATARFMETWAHGRDVIDALAVLIPPSERLRHVVHLGLRTRDYAFQLHGLKAPEEEFRVELISPAGESWVYGPEDAAQQVRGSAYDFCLLVTQRRDLSDLDLTARGDDATTWLGIAQAFAGPPGRGRKAGARRSASAVGDAE